MREQTLRIGAVAARAGVSPDTLRHYERLGVLSKPLRNDAGYRVYPEASVARVQFIRNALRFGFSLKQIGTFVRACEAGRPPCHQVRIAAGQILQDMDRQIDELTEARAAMRRTLVEWDDRLAVTPGGKAARLLDAMAPSASIATSKPRRPLSRPR